MGRSATAVVKPSARVASPSEELSLTSDNKAKFDQLINDYISGIPAGGSKEYRDKIDAAVSVLDGVNRYSDKALNDAFRQLTGQLVPLKVKPGNNLSPEERKTNDENAALRENASRLAKDGLSLFPVPSVSLPAAINYTLTTDIEDESRRAIALSASHPHAALQQYSDYLLLQLTGEHPGDRAAAEIARKQGSEIPPVRSVKVPPWNSVNIVTAIYQLNKVDPKWYARPHAQPLAEALIDRLAKTADKQVFDARSVSNLAEAAPALFKYFERLNPKNPILEKRFIGALSRAVENSSELPDERYADKSFLFPMREIRSCNLSPEGAAALCSYVAKLNHLFSQVSYRNHLPTIAATFHAFNGVSSWANSSDSERKLTVMLNNLNDRLERSPNDLEPIAAASIIYGLRGLDVRHLGSDAITQVTRTMRFVTEGMNAMPSHVKLDHRALSSIAHGLIIPLTITEGAVYRATKDLLAAVERRLPGESTSLDQLGALCGVLTTLRPHRHEYQSLVSTLFSDVHRAASGPLTTFHQDYNHHIAWQVIQQAHALYNQPLHTRLQNTIEKMAPFVTGGMSSTQSETRMRGWVSQHPGVQVVDIVFQDGFELDLLVLYKGRLVNIEIDGRHHNEPCQKIIDHVRDQHLETTRQYEIVRLPNWVTEQEVHAILDNLRP